jgi:adenylosuccinate synthase
MPRAFLVIGLGFGDEGKGSVVDHLVRRHRIRQVVRFNGGAQARHHVVAGSLVHGFSQFGAGTLAGAGTLLSRFMLVNPLSLCGEARALARAGVPDPFARLRISDRAPIISPPNILANRIQELHRSSDRHGSCGMGIGLTQGDVEALGDEALVAADLRDARRTRQKLEQLRARRISETAPLECEATVTLRAELTALDLRDLADFYTEFAATARIVADTEIVEQIARAGAVFEGAQGVLLDQAAGFFPHVTRANTTFANADLLLEEAGCSGQVVRIGLLRGYATRHGAGPIPTETYELRVPPCDNATNPWQGSFRTGWFDAVAARYALEVVGGVDLLGLTNLDRLVGPGPLRAAVTYGPTPDFPGGRVPPAPPDLERLARRTEALLAARPSYVPVAAIEQPAPAAYRRYAARLSELLGRRVDLISASPGPEKLYQCAESG